MVPRPPDEAWRAGRGSAGASRERERSPPFRDGVDSPKSHREAARRRWLRSAGYPDAGPGRPAPQSVMRRRTARFSLRICEVSLRLPFTRWGMLISSWKGPHHDHDRCHQRGFIPSRRRRLRWLPRVGEPARPPQGHGAAAIPRRHSSSCNGTRRGSDVDQIG
jgi:hypothetical protein